MVLNKIPTFNEVKTWVNNNADVPNADHADDSDTLQGNAPDELGGLDYIQDTEPSSPTDGEAWADTSTSLRTLYVYSTDRGEWVPTFESVPLFVTQEAVSFGESEVNTDADTAFIDNGALSLPTPPFTDNFNTVDLGSFDGSAFLRMTPAQTCDVTFHTEPNSAWQDPAHIEGPSGTQKTFTAGDDVTFTDIPGGVQSKFTVSPEGQCFGADDYRPDLPFINFEFSQEWYGIEGLTISNFPVTDEDISVGFSSIPDDLTAWDRISWQKDDGGGSVTADIETNDGTGWSDFATDVAAPYSIASVPTDNDVRVNFNLSRPSNNDTSPIISYAARRGER